MRGRSGDKSYHRFLSFVEGWSSPKQGIAGGKGGRPEDAGPGDASRPVGHTRVPL